MDQSMYVRDVNYQRTYLNTSSLYFKLSNKKYRRPIKPKTDGEGLGWNTGWCERAPFCRQVGPGSEGYFRLELENPREIAFDVNPNVANFGLLAEGDKRREPNKRKFFCHKKKYSLSLEK